MNMFAPSNLPRMIGLIAVAIGFTVGAPPLVSASDLAPPSLSEPTDVRQMKFAPVQFNPPEPDRIILDNGMVDGPGG